MGERESIALGRMFYNVAPFTQDRAFHMYHLVNGFEDVTEGGFQRPRAICGRPVLLHGHADLVWSGHAEIFLALLSRTAS